MTAPCGQVRGASLRKRSRQGRKRQPVLFTVGSRAPSRRGIVSAMRPRFHVPSRPWPCHARAVRGLLEPRRRPAGALPRRRAELVFPQEGADRIGLRPGLRALLLPPMDGTAGQNTHAASATAWSTRSAPDRADPKLLASRAESQEFTSRAAHLLQVRPGHSAAPSLSLLPRARHVRGAFARETAGSDFAKSRRPAAPARLLDHRYRMRGVSTTPPPSFWRAIFER